MKRNQIILLAACVVALTIAYLLLPNRAPAEPLADRREYSAYVERTTKEKRWAPIYPWWERQDIPGGWRAAKAERLTVRQGEAYLGDAHIPNDQIRQFLDQQVARGEIDYVVLFPSPGTRWGEIFPTLDECRKSDVRAVLLNQFE